MKTQFTSRYQPRATWERQVILGAEDQLGPFFQRVGCTISMRDIGVMQREELAGQIICTKPINIGTHCVLHSRNESSGIHRNVCPDVVREPGYFGANVVVAERRID